MVPLEPQIDPVSVAVAIVTALVGGVLAPYVGPYIIIAIAGAAGSGFALGRWRECTRFEAAGYMFGMTVVALLLTVPFTELLLWLSPDLLHLSSRWALAPVAALIGGIGHDWPKVGGWLIERAARVFDRKAGTPE